MHRSSENLQFLDLGRGSEIKKSVKHARDILFVPRYEPASLSFFRFCGCVSKADVGDVFEGVITGGSRRRTGKLVR
jgi:hypothetical protein